MFKKCIKTDFPAHAAITGARNRSLNEDWSAKFLSVGSDIERMQVLDVSAVYFRLGQNVNGVRAAVDHWGSSDPHLWRYVLTSDFAAGDRTTSCRQQADMPIHDSRIGIHGVKAVVFGCYKDDVVRPPPRWLGLTCTGAGHKSVHRRRLRTSSQTWLNLRLRE